jgi:hypothetical protein
MAPKLSPREKAALATQMMNRVAAPSSLPLYFYRNSGPSDQFGSDRSGNGSPGRQGF